MKGILAVLTVVLCIPCFSQEQNKDKNAPAQASKLTHEKWQQMY